MSHAIDHMRHALALGRRGQGRTAPNPAVGCVIVKYDRIIGRGWTQPGGRPHAEVRALSQAGAQARGASAYVTLEPCSHHGKTGPCALALIEAGVSHVSVAIEDPDPRVSGRGLAMLRDAGITVDVGLCADEAARDLRGFLLSRTEGRPELMLKLALSLDGRIATASGESQWITGPEARRRVHAMRATHDAVLVGGGTARADDPSLTVRGLGVSHQPVRVVLSRKLDVPLESNLARTAHEVPVWIMHGVEASPEARAAWEAKGARLFEISRDGPHLDPVATLKTLADAGITRVFCEGGGQLAGSLLARDCVDRLAVFSAGLALGAEGQPGIGALGLERLSEARRFARVTQQAIGPDTLTLWER